MVVRKSLIQYCCILTLSTLWQSCINIVRPSLVTSPIFFSSLLQFVKKWYKSKRIPPPPFLLVQLPDKGPLLQTFNPAYVVSGTERSYVFVCFCLHKRQHITWNFGHFAYTFLTSGYPIIKYSELIFGIIRLQRSGLGKFLNKKAKCLQCSLFFFVLVFCFLDNTNKDLVYLFGTATNSTYELNTRTRYRHGV